MNIATKKQRNFVNNMKLGLQFQLELKVVEIQTALKMGISFTKCKLLQKVVKLL